MSYLVLARKSRPQTFDQVIGQGPVIKTLRNSLAKNRVAHALLFSGVRGVGKTTLARIMAKAINCERRDDNPPCNKCTSCREITAGSSLDLYEIDGASNRGINEIRELREKIRFLPTTSKYRVVIIDEVHMLTTEAFNALLKTLEEPPEHVYFMFATTELHKIPITILSRCQQYELKRVQAQELSEHFARLVEADGKSIEAEALSLIVREAQGSVRDGLSLLDQVLSFSDNNVHTDDVIQVLGLVNRDVLMGLCRALLDGDRAKAILSLEEIFRYGMDIKRFCTDIISYFRTLLLCKIEGCRELVDLPDDEFARFSEMAQNYSTESLHLKMNMLIDMVDHIGRSNQPRIVLETTFLKIIEAGNITPVNDILGKLGSLLQGSEITLPKKKASSIEQAAPTQTASPTIPPKTTPAPREQALLGQESPVPLAPQQEQPPVPEEPPQEFISLHTEPVELPKSQEVASLPQKTAPIDKNSRDIHQAWDAFIDYTSDQLSWMGRALAHAKPLQREDKIILEYKNSNDCGLLSMHEHSAKLQKFVLDFFGKKLKVEFSFSDMGGVASKDKGSQAIINELQHHPLVTATAEIFRGDVSNVRPSFKKKQ